MTEPREPAATDARPHDEVMAGGSLRPIGHAARVPAGVDPLELIPRDRHRTWLAAHAFHACYGHLTVPACVIVDGVDLDRGLAAVRYAYRRERMAAAETAVWESLGIAWRLHDRGWREGIAAWHTFHRLHGHRDAPDDYRMYGVMWLQTWRDRQQRRYHENQLTPVQVTELNQACGLHLLPPPPTPPANPTDALTEVGHQPGSRPTRRGGPPTSARPRRHHHPQRHAAARSHGVRHRLPRSRQRSPSPATAPPARTGKERCWAADNAGGNSRHCRWAHRGRQRQSAATLGHPATGRGRDRRPDRCGRRGRGQPPARGCHAARQQCGRTRPGRASADERPAMTSARTTRGSTSTIQRILTGAGVTTAATEAVAADQAVSQ